MPKPSEQTRQLNVSVSPMLRRAIERRAKRSKRKLSEHVRLVLAADCGDESLAEVRPPGRQSAGK